MLSFSSLLSQARPSFRVPSRASQRASATRAQGPRIEAPAHAEVELHIAVPTVEALVDQARRWTQSCVLVEQLDVCGKFFQKMAVRGLMHGKYSPIDVEKLGSLVEFMIATRAAEIGRTAG